MRPRPVIILCLACSALAAADKKPLDHSVYDGWNSIRGTALSRNGEWLAYSISPQEGDGTATIRNLNDGRTVTIPRGTDLRFTRDSRFLVSLVSPKFEDTRAAKRKKAKPEDMPKASLAIVDLRTTQKVEIEKVRSYDLAPEDSGWLVYKPEPPKAETKGSEASKADKSEKKEGEPYVLRRLDSGKEERLERVSSETFGKYGTALAYATATKDGKGDGVFLYDLVSGHKSVVTNDSAEYPQLSLNSTGSKLAFLSKKDAGKDKPEIIALHLYDSVTKKQVRVGADSLTKGWTYSEKQPLRFSEKGTRLLYHTCPTPPLPAKEVPDDEKVSVDIWNWKDDRLQTQQLIEAQRDRDRGYLASYDLKRQRSVQLESADLPTVDVADKGDGRYALATTETPYQRESSWNPGRSDVYVVDVDTGARRRISAGAKSEATISPGGNFAALYDGDAKSWSIVDCASGRAAPVAIPVPVFDELEDMPESPPAYGIAGWTKNDGAVLIEDRFDIWSADPTGKASPRRLTRGRDRELRFRPIDLDPENPYLDPEHLLLAAFDEETKQAGVYRLSARGEEKIFLEDKLFTGFLEAKNSDRLVFTRQDFTEYPDLWVSDTSFHEPKKVTDANPQQKNYVWGREELVRWTSLDGVKLEGILIKPENFDYGKKYPLITYFYERNSDTLHAYHAPAPSASTVNLAYFASNGYCIFIPDIPYRVGYPGYSALSAIVPGVQSIVSRGYIDPARLGIQGQSWGGYQVAYLVTQTNMFAAAEAGAPVGDMFSAYGGIRYGSGIVREFQYEHSQSRIGGTPWDSTLRFVENSPVFFADKIQTPLMIMSNDKDGAVPHTQGIELFTALRRLDKPCWMVVYNGEDHNIMERKNRKDFSVRLSQFFDHFLKGSPTPVWMSKGVPAVDKGRTMGLGLDGSGGVPPP